MLLVIPDLLSPEQTRQCRDALAQADWRFSQKVQPAPPLPQLPSRFGQLTGRPTGSLYTFSPYRSFR